MMTTQKDAAVNAMLSWLMDDHVLKQIPQDLECTNDLIFTSYITIFSVFVNKSMIHGY